MGSIKNTRKDELIQFTNEYDNLKQHYRFYSIKFDRGLKKQVDWSCLFIFFQIGASFSQTNVSCYVVDIQVNIDLMSS